MKDLQLLHRRGKQHAWLQHLTAQVNCIRDPGISWVLFIQQQLAHLSWEEFSLKPSQFSLKSSQVNYWKTGEKMCPEAFQLNSARVFWEGGMTEGAVFCLQAELQASGTEVRGLLLLPSLSGVSMGWWPTALGEQQHGCVGEKLCLCQHVIAKCCFPGSYASNSITWVMYLMLFFFLLNVYRIQTSYVR